MYLIHVYSLASDLVTVSPLWVLGKCFFSLILPGRIFNSFFNRVWYKVVYIKKKTIKYSDLQTTLKENMTNLSQEKLLNQQAFKQIGICSYQQNTLDKWKYIKSHNYIVQMNQTVFYIPWRCKDPLRASNCIAI